jgi:parvulin-like peptidyl-prolyl cis-trans isomerase-like protein
MHPRTFAVVSLLLATGCGSAVAAHGGDAPPTAPPIAAEMSRAPVAPAPPDAQDPRSPSRVMAYVEGEVITYREILQRIGPELAELESPAEKARMEERELMNVLRDRLLFRAAADAGVHVTRDELDAKRAKAVRDLAKSGGTLEAFLHEHDMTRREFDEFNRVQIVNDKYRRAAIGHNNDPGVRVRAVTDTYVAPEEVRKYYDRHPEQFNEPPGARYRMLLVKSKLDTPDRVASVAAARAVAESAVARLQGGEGREPEDWVPVYRELNQSPPDPRQPDGLCSIERGKAADWIEKFAFESPKGAVHLEQIGTTFYVLQAEGAHDARVRLFEEAGPEIRQKLEQCRIGMAFLEVELSVLDESSVQPESVRANLRSTLSRARRGFLEEAER